MAAKKKIPGWQKLLDDVKAVEKVFARRTADKVEAMFVMSDWGQHEGAHKPEEKNYCGTSACLAGWLATAGKHEFRGVWRAQHDDFDHPRKVTGHLLGAPKKYGNSFENMAEKVYGMSSLDAYRLFMTNTSYCGRDILEEKLADACAVAYALRDEAKLVKKVRS